MEPNGIFIAYLTIHRVLVFAAGILAIVLGYRLLMRGLPGGGGQGAQSQSVEASVGKAKLSARNLAPGSLFALFGAVMVAGMALHRPPEISLDQLAAGGARMRATMRGDEPSSRQDGSAAEALRLLEEGNVKGAAAMAAQVARSSAADWNNVAWVNASAGGNADVALALAQAAVAAAPTSAEFLHTLATVQRWRGELPAALRSLRQAAAIDPRFAATVKQWESGARGK